MAGLAEGAAAGGAAAGAAVAAPVERSEAGDDATQFSRSPSSLEGLRADSGCGVQPAAALQAAIPDNQGSFTRTTLALNHFTISFCFHSRNGVCEKGSGDQQRTSRCVIRMPFPASNSPLDTSDWKRALPSRAPRIPFSECVRLAPRLRCSLFLPRLMLCDLSIEVSP